MRPKKSGPPILLIVGIVAAVGFAVLVIVPVVGLVVWLGLSGEFVPPDFGPLGGGLAVGEKAPAIEAAAWLNGDPPQPSDLDGRVVVVEAWASW